MAGLTARTLAEITADALRTGCACCMAEPHIPCAGGGTHLQRFQRARRKGLLSAADVTAVMAAVIASLVSFAGEVPACPT